MAGFSEDTSRAQLWLRMPRVRRGLSAAYCPGPGFFSTMYRSSMSRGVWSAEQSHRVGGVLWQAQESLLLGVRLAKASC